MRKQHRMVLTRVIASFVLPLLVLGSGCNRVPEGNVNSEMSSKSAEFPVVSEAPPQEPVAPGGDFGVDGFNDWQRDAYRRLEQGEVTPETPYIFESRSTDEVRAVCELYNANHIEDWWLKPAFELRFSDPTLEDISSVNAIEARWMGERTPEQRSGMYAEMEAAAAEILAGIPAGADEYETAKYLAEELCRRTEYDYPAAYGGYEGLTQADYKRMGESAFAYGPLANGYGICTGYAAAFQLLAKRAGLYSICVSGNTLPFNFHTWNMVWMGDGFYHLDVTWMDNAAGIDYAYFLAGDAQLAENHGPAHFGIDAVNSFMQPPAPAATATANTYFIREGLHFSTAGQAIDWLNTIQPVEGERIQLQLGSEEEYYRFRHALYAVANGDFSPPLAPGLRLVIELELVSARVVSFRAAAGSF